ncbi:MAG TPA: phosphatidylserine decarboxylase [Elusimicrobiales bacterium]|nr:phosphatidylserine decarboxylase [Elusimicrobiales bacterium]
MGIVPEGLKLIYAAAAAAAAGGVICVWSRWAGIPILALGSLIALFTAYFFRDPERNRVFSPEEIACPADGTVLSVGSEGDPDVIVVRIFLSVFNVHLQRATIDGKIESVTYTRGKFEIAYKPEAVKNERNLIKINGANGRFAHVEQLTGSIARRIVAYVEAGDEVKAGERIGMIYFGSQVAVYLPKDASVLVKPGDKVYGAETVLGRWPR